MMMMMMMTYALPPQLLHRALARPQSDLQERQLRRQSCGPTPGYHDNQRQSKVCVCVCEQVSHLSSSSSVGPVSSRCGSVGPEASTLQRKTLRLELEHQHDT